MKNLKLDDIRVLHRQGERTLAKKGYLALLRQNPKNIEALHGLGILYIQEEEFQKAITTLKKALNYAKDAPEIALNLANVLKIKGDYLEASNLLQRIIQEHPHYAPAYNNLGTLCYKEEKWDEAIAYFRSSLKLSPAYIDALYNLGLAYGKKAEWDEAIRAYRLIVEHNPDHFAARYLLASALMHQNNFNEAIQEFLKIEENHPHHFETESNLATAFLKVGALKEAKMHYLKAHQLRPEDPQILYNLGVIHMQQDLIDEAIPFYQKALQHAPNSFAIHNNLGVAFLIKHHIAYALDHFKEALRLEPHNESLAYIVNMLTTRQELHSAPRDYIISLFDAYADHYDSHLMHALDYKLPELFKNAYLAVTKNQKKLQDILDLGCGTGLCGVLFKPFAKTLVGVDLSTQMLKEAKTKSLYDTLINQDITEFLQDKVELYDLILAGDVFVYIGDLQNIFALIKRALRAQGIFIFNTEISEIKAFTMNQSGRFSHHADYIKELITQNEFDLLSAERQVTRIQNNTEAFGFLYVLRKSAIH